MLSEIDTKNIFNLPFNAWHHIYSELPPKDILSLGVASSEGNKKLHELKIGARIINLQTDVWLIINLGMSTQDTFNLSLTCHQGNKMFHQLVTTENVANRRVTIPARQTFIPSIPWITRGHKTGAKTRTEPIATVLPGCRRERFTACGQNGAEHLRIEHEIDSYFDRQRIADGESIESVKQDRADKLKHIRDMRNDPNTPQQYAIGEVIHNQLVLDLVLDDVFTLEEACEQELYFRELYHVRGRDQYAARYQLTRKQVHDIILKQFNPFEFEIIQMAIDKKYLKVEQVVLLDRDAVSKINVKHHGKYIFLETVRKFKLTPEQAFNLIEISCRGSNPLCEEKNLTKAIKENIVNYDLAVCVHRSQASRIDFKKLNTLISNYKLTQEQNFIVITQEAYHLCDLETWVINDGVLTFDQAINLLFWQRETEYLKQLRTCKNKYALTTEQVSDILRHSSHGRPINLTVDVIKWAIEESILTVDQGIRFDYDLAVFLASYRRFLGETNSNTRTTTNSNIAYQTARKLIDQLVLPRQDDYVAELAIFEQIELDGLSAELQRRLKQSFSGLCPMAIVYAKKMSDKLQSGAAIYQIFEDLLALYNS